MQMQQMLMAELVVDERRRHAARVNRDRGLAEGPGRRAAAVAARGPERRVPGPVRRPPRGRRTGPDGDRAQRPTSDRAASTRFALASAGTM